MPVYYKYTFPANVKSVFINIKSKDDLCTSVSVQSFYCPVYDVNEIGIRQGRYQTMSKGASFNIYVTNSPTSLTSTHFVHCSRMNSAIAMNSCWSSLSSQQMWTA